MPNLSDRASRRQRKISKVMRDLQRGQLKSGSGRKVKSRRQAIAIALSEARRGKK